MWYIRVSNGKYCYYSNIEGSLETPYVKKTWYTIIYDRRIFSEYNLKSILYELATPNTLIVYIFIVRVVVISIIDESYLDNLSFYLMNSVIRQVMIYLKTKSVMNNMI